MGAVGVGAFGEQDDAVAVGEALGYRVALLPGAAAALAFDEDRAGQGGEPADETPAGKIGAGDEGGGNTRAEDRDVGP
nr:hypothetical protein [Polymorphobacter glacialis]